MQSKNARSICAMTGSVLMFSLMDAVMKLLSAHYPPMQVAALRGMLSILMLWLFVYALHLLPMTEAYALFFVAPLLITVLSVLFLGERVKPSRWLAIGAGMAGASAIAPFEYTALAWGMSLDRVLWNNHYTLLGAAIIAGSGIYLIRRENVRTDAEHP